MMSGRGSSFSDPWKAMMVTEPEAQAPYQQTSIALDRTNSNNIDPADCLLYLREPDASTSPADSTRRLAQAVEAQPLAAAEGDRQRVGGVGRPAPVGAGQQGDQAGGLVLAGAAGGGRRRAGAGR